MASRQHVNMMSGQSGQMGGRPGQQVGRSGQPKRVVHGGLGKAAQQQMRMQHLQQQAQKQGGLQRVVQAENQVQYCFLLQIKLTAQVTV